MSHCSRKRSFPHWEKKHRKRRMKAIVKEADKMLVGLVPSLTESFRKSDELLDQLLKPVRDGAGPKWDGRVVKFSLGVPNGR